LPTSCNRDVPILKPVHASGVDPRFTKLRRLVISCPTEPRYVDYRIWDLASPWRPIPPFCPGCRQFGRQFVGKTNCGAVERERMAGRGLVLHPLVVLFDDLVGLGSGVPQCLLRILDAGEHLLNAP
jgi:hypothetical protein